jgi:hypothetical protein
MYNDLIENPSSTEAWFNPNQLIYKHVESIRDTNVSTQGARNLFRACATKSCVLPSFYGWFVGDFATRLVPPFDSWPRTSPMSSSGS